MLPRYQEYGEEEEEEGDEMNEETPNLVETKESTSKEISDEVSRFIRVCRKEITSDVVYNQLLQLLNLYAQVGMS